MKLRLYFFLFIIFLSNYINVQSQTIETDSLALVALYDSTDGANWTDNTNWLSDEPVANWYGVTVSSERVNTLYLDSNQLSGRIPAALGTLTDLSILSLSGNQLSYSIPFELGNLASLTRLYLMNNQLTGSIPAELGNMTNLQLLHIYSNQLSGSIPPELSNLTNLLELSLFENQLTGSIPTELGIMTNLTKLLLSANLLTGAIPAELGNMTNLEYLILHNNQITGSIPLELGNLANLTRLYLNGNQFTGSIPKELGNLTNLQYLYLYSNQLSGAIPLELGNLANLRLLELQSNQLTGAIPLELGNLANLTILQLELNQLSSTIPVSLGTLSNLTHLMLQGNQLSGTIPTQLGNLTNLIYLHLNHNQLTGSIPIELGSLTFLKNLTLHYNQLVGTIPVELGNLANLIYLYLDRNQLKSPIPSEIESLANLDNLGISSNKFTFGDIEPYIGLPVFQYSPQDTVGVSIDTVLVEGTNFTYTVTVGGTANQYQWYKNGNPVAGQTNSTLTLSNVSNADDGLYIAYVTNTLVTGLTIYTKPITISTVSTVTDIDGNVYKTVIIGNREWMAENLRVTKYQDGSAIPNVTDNTAWNNLSTGAYSAYNNDENNAATYGYLYNWYAVVDIRELAPTGWHVPTDVEWQELEMHLGMSQTEADGSNWRGTDEGRKLKETGTTHWNSPNAGTNESGFTALPGGVRGSSGAYYDVDSGAFFWTSSERDIGSNFAWSRRLYYDYSDVDRNSASGETGKSVRLIKDNNLPTITDIPDQSINEDEDTGSLLFTVSDTETATSALTVSGTSSNTILVPNANITFVGSGGSRTVTVTPGANLSGTSTITITVSDGTDSTTDTFLLTVTSVNDAPTITDIPDQSINEDEDTGSLLFTVSDTETATSELAVSGTSSNQTLVKDARIVLGGTDANRNVIISPESSQYGTSTITVTVSDGTDSATDTFLLTVGSSNGSPVFNNLSSMTYVEGTKIEFDVGVTYTGSNSLEYTLTSNLPNGAGASFNSNTKKFLWNANFHSSGIYTLTFTVSDGVLSTSQTITLTVTDVDFNDGVAKADTAIVTKDNGGSVKVKDTGQYKEHKVNIPAGAMKSDANVIVGPPSVVDIPLAEIEACPSAVDFSVDGFDDYTFTDSVEITIEFKDFEVTDKVENMRVHNWDKTNQRWHRVMSPQWIDETTKTVKVKTNHFSIYGVIEVDEIASSESIGTGWNMVAVPLETQGTNDPVSLFSSYFNLFNFEARDSYIYEYNESSSSWVLPSEIQYGKGYLLYGVKQSTDIGIAGLEVTGDFTRNLSLTNSNGWHLVGNPYSVDAEWGTVITGDSDVDVTFYRWVGGQYLYYPGGGLSTASIEPWQAFWVHTTADAAELNFVYPGPGASKVSSKEPDIDWRMQIIAESHDSKDTYSYIGQAKASVAGLDRNDVYELAPISDKFVSLSFDVAGKDLTQSISDVRDEAVWNMKVVSKTSSGDVNIRWSVPEELEAYDLTLQTADGELVDMRTESAFSFSVTPQTAKFSTLQVNKNVDPTFSKTSLDGATENHFIITMTKHVEEDDAAIPTDYYLNQNYPNPFNPNTKIGYGLPNAGHVTLTVYNILGQEVATLVKTEQNAGRFSVNWNGRNSLGKKVTSGVYIYRITSGNFTKVNKMLLIK